MTNPHDATGVAAPRDLFWWPRGRAGRGEYWTHVAVLFGLNLLLGQIAPAVGFAIAAVYLVVQMRRLHDIGRSGWWAVAAFVGALAVTVPLEVLGLSDPAIAVAAVATLVPLIWIGVVPGDREPNRFGPPPPFSVRRVLTGR